MKKILIFISVFLLFTCPLAQAKKKEEKKKSPLSYKDLHPSQKVFYLGSLLLSGRSQEAIQLLLANNKLKMDDKLKNRLQFIQAYLSLLQGKPQEAAMLFETLSGKYAELNPILPYWLARAQRLSGEAQKAIATLEKFCKGACDSAHPSSSRIQREYASSLCAGDKTDPAYALFNELISQTKGELDREYARLDLIECEFQHGKLEEAYQELRTTFNHAQGGISKDYLLKILHSIHQKKSEIPEQFAIEDRMARIDSLKSQERYVDAASEYKFLWPQLSAADQSARLEDAAEVYFKARYYRDSAPLYEQLVKNAAEPSQHASYLEKLASAYARSNQFEKAIATQKEIASAQDKDSAKIDYKIAFLIADSGQCEKAIKAFEDFIQNYPNSSKVEEAHWRKAWCLAQTGKFEDSIHELEILNKTYPKRTAYWKMRWYEEAGKKGEMKEAKEELFAKAPGSFYPHWESFVRGNSKHQCPEVDQVKLFAKKENPPLSSLFSSHSSPEDETLKELLILGMWEDFLDFYSQGKKDASPENFQQNLSDWINFFAYTEQVPPELIWAVMKEESRFNAKALSPAGAMGLMQIIPQTGYEIAQDLNLSSYSSSDLLKPLINLRFGSYYLSKLLRQFSGNIVHTIAAYNAGPLAVERWSEQHSHQACDEFIEEIPYRETYNYVMKVMQSFWNYQNGNKNASSKEEI